MIDEQREQKRKIVKIAFQQIDQEIEDIKKLFPKIEFDFCWDECIWVDDEFFCSRDDAFDVKI